MKENFYRGSLITGFNQGVGTPSLKFLYECCHTALYTLYGGFEYILLK